jgi:hypothetical protein
VIDVPTETPRRHELRGHIVSAGFESGDRFVVGLWEDGPLGPMVDVMWARPDGERVLLVPRADVGEYIGGIYRFDCVTVAKVEGACDGRGAFVVADGLALHLDGARWALPLPSAPPWFVRHVEGPIARVVLGVRTYGVTSTGVREWYRARRFRPVRSGTAMLDGVSLGRLGPIAPACGFGFSEPPRRPAIVSVRPLLELSEPLRGGTRQSSNDR